MEKISTILLVDDDKMDIALTLDTFQQSGLTSTIQVARNGKEALQYLMGEEKYADRITYPLPDVVLLDINMPIINGYEVLERVQESKPEIRRIPILILTFSTEEGERILNLYSGASGYLVKPIAIKEFFEVLKKVSNYTITLNAK